jgi:membrane-associated phospholipid phosphatase
VAWPQLIVRVHKPRTAGILRNQTLLTLLLASATPGACGIAWAQMTTDPSPAPAADAAMSEPTPPPATPPTGQAAPSNAGLVSDIKLYFTAPLRWDAGDWAWFGGALLAIGAAHHYDTQVRSHFVEPGQTINSDDVQDAIPTAAVLVATWGYANLIDSSDGRREAWAMLEAAGLSSVTAYALKYAVGREGPDQTSDPNEWLKGGGGSFPSWHSTAAFAVGTVLAESGNDEYRWLRRVLGYGLGVATSYERLKHNAHWLSDTVAGAALGGATAHFTMNRVYRTDDESSLSVVPIQGGAMLTYRVSLP